MLAFHGFNRSSDDFIPYGKLLGEHYTILAFDLFFHGKSEVRGDFSNPAFILEELKEAMDSILSRYWHQEFEILAHSFGGRFAFNLLELYPQRIKGMYLMAPDALRFNAGYWLATQTRLGKLLIRRYRSQPDLIIRFLQLLPKTGFYSEKAVDFYISQISYGPVREKVYRVWMAHRLSGINPKKMSELIRENRIPFLLFLGQFDTIISHSAGKKMVDRCGETARLIMINSGHRVHEKHHEVCHAILNRDQK